MQRAANPWDRFYHLHAAPWRGERAISDLLPLLDQGGGAQAGPVLELGCGNGKLLRPLHAAGVEAIGLDISFHALSRLERGPVVLADAAALPFATGVFAAVFDIHCTGHLLATGRRAAAQEKLRVLRAGGHLVVERLAPEDLRAARGTEPEPGTRELVDGRTTHFSTAADIVAEHRGLSLVDAQPTVRETRHRGVDVTRASVRVVLRKP